MALLSTDDHWPSLAPIRTSGSSACTHASDKETYPTGREQPSSYGSGGNHVDQAAGAYTPTPEFSRNSPFSQKPGCPNSSRPSDSACCYINKLLCADLLPNCFSCVRPRRHRTSTSPRHRCTPTCMMHKNKYALRSLAFLFPSAGKVQSFYSSTPTAKAQLSGTYPRTPSGKIARYMSPHTPGPTALSSQLSGKNSQFSSPRTPASVVPQVDGDWSSNFCKSMMLESSKVQHFSGAIPSPRTPYASSLATSPASALRKKPSFTLAVPPGVMDRKKAFEQIVDEPTSPHVTCIGRVRQQTHCKKLLRSDTIDLCTHRRHHDKIAKNKGTSIRLSSKHHSFPATHGSNNVTESQRRTDQSSLVPQQPTNILEACIQRFGKEKLDNLHKIQGDGHNTSYACNNVLFEAEQMARTNGGQGAEEDTTSIADCSNNGVHVASDHGSHIAYEGTALCMKSVNPQVNAHKNSSIDTECIAAVGRPPECSDTDAASTEIPAQQVMSSICVRESLDDDGEELHAKPHHQAQRCLLLMRSTGSRRLTEADRVSLASCINQNAIRE